MVSQKLTAELQQIMREEYKINLDIKGASEVARKLTDAFDVLSEIDFKDDTKNAKKPNNQIELSQSNATINEKA